MVPKKAANSDKGKKNKANGNTKGQNGSASKELKRKKSSADNKSKMKVVVQSQDDRRDENWSSGEKDVLVQQCIANIALLDSNLTSEITRDVKNKKWKDIADAVNA